MDPCPINDATWSIKMTGILLLFVVAIWFAIVLWLTRIIAKKLPDKWWATPIVVLVFCALLPLPLADEIVGGRQFEQLCKENSTIQIDRTTAVGKTVYPAKTLDVDIKGTWVGVALQPRRLVDATTGESIVSFNDLIASGGWFIRALGISEGGVPLTFKGWCQPGDQHAVEKLLKELNITLIRRPDTNTGESK
jgi:hypothetical protein